MTRNQIETNENIQNHMLVINQGRFIIPRNRERKYLKLYKKKRINFNNCDSIF